MATTRTPGGARDTLAPEDVEAKTFTAVRLREGYDMAEVDSFLDEVVGTLRRLLSENDELRHGAGERSAGRLDGTAAADGVPATSATEDGVTGEPAAATEAVGGSGTAPARPPTTAEATSAAVRVLQLAEEEAERARTEAEAAAQARRSAADATAREVEQAARDRSAALDGEVATRRRELFAQLESDRGALTEEVDGLRAFEQEYRTRLRAWFAQQLQHLDTGADVGDGTVAGPAPVGAAAAATDEQATARSGSSRLGRLLETDSTE